PHPALRALRVLTVGAARRVLIRRAPLPPPPAPRPPLLFPVPRRPSLPRESLRVSRPLARGPRASPPPSRPPRIGSRAAVPSPPSRPRSSTARRTTDCGSLRGRSRDQRHRRAPSIGLAVHSHR